MLGLNVWVEQSWHDERISWEPAEFGEINKLTIATEHIFVPDIVLYNKFNKYNAMCQLFAVPAISRVDSSRQICTS